MDPAKAFLGKIGVITIFYDKFVTVVLHSAEFHVKEPNDRPVTCCKKLSTLRKVIHKIQRFPNALASSFVTRHMARDSMTEQGHLVFPVVAQTARALFELIIVPYNRNA